MGRYSSSMELTPFPSTEISLKMNKKRSSHLNGSGNGKRVCNFDTRHGYEILKMLEEEIGIVERILYVSRNQHRGCVYFKSMSNVLLFLRCLTN